MFKFYSHGSLERSHKKNAINLQTYLVTDGGPENQRVVSRFIDESSSINHLVSQKDIIQSNSMVEAVNKHIKYHYLFKEELSTFNETVCFLSSSIDDYNNKPHGRLYVFTPNEVLNGIPPNRENFRNEIAKARRNSLIQNQSKGCCQSVKDKSVGFTKLAQWYDQVEKAGFKSFNTIARTIQQHYQTILNFFERRSTNAAAESFNANLLAVGKD